MKNSKRSQRVSDEVKRILSETLLYKIADPRVAGVVTVTDVSVTGDLSLAKVYYSVLDDAARKSAAEGLKKAKSFLRRELGQKIYLRKVPDLVFVEDRTSLAGEAIDRLLDKVKGRTEDDEQGEVFR